MRWILWWIGLIKVSQSYGLTDTLNTHIHDGDDVVRKPKQFRKCLLQSCLLKHILKTDRFHGHGIQMGFYKRPYTIVLNCKQGVLSYNTTQEGGDFNLTHHSF